MNITNITADYINRINETFIDIKNKYTQNKQIVADADDETLDLLHEIEMTNFNAFQGWRLAFQLKCIRKKRRIASDENKLLSEVVLYLNERQKEEDKLIQLKENSNVVFNSLQNRIYIPRKRDDLQCSTIVENIEAIRPKLNGAKFDDSHKFGYQTDTSQKISSTNFDQLLKKFKQEDKAKKTKKYK